MKRELEDKDIRWLSERIESINKEFKERIGFSLTVEKADEKAKGEDIVDPKYADASPSKFS
jgi:hypothetical protein